MMSSPNISDRRLIVSSPAVYHDSPQKGLKWRKEERDKKEGRQRRGTKEGEQAKEEEGKENKKEPGKVKEGVG